MKKQYAAPTAELLEFDYQEIVTASGPMDITRTPSRHYCTVLPNGKPIPHRIIIEDFEDEEEMP